jgi:hypothetical protein
MAANGTSYRGPTGLAVKVPEGRHVVRVHF